MLDIFQNVFSDKYQEFFFFKCWFRWLSFALMFKGLFVVFFFFFTNTVAIDLPGGEGFFKDM